MAKKDNDDPTAENRKRTAESARRLRSKADTDGLVEEQRALRERGEAEMKRLGFGKDGK
jgi:hypothetical protein